MIYRILADAVVILHFCFVIFVVLGGVAVIRAPRLAWLHVPAAIWGALIEFAGWICPLTPLENSLRRRGGEAGYEGGFVEHYVTAVMYPEGLTRELQWVLGTLVLVLNVVVYWIVIARRRAGGSRRAN